jgi:hypothetical protein
MALQTYNDLIQALQDWMEDDDAEFQGSLNDVVDLGEQRLARDLDLAIFRRTTTTALVIGTATVTKPSVSPEYLIATKALWLTGGALTTPVFLEVRDQGYVTWATGTTNGVPLFWAEENETSWTLAPAPDATYTLNIRYLSRPTKLAPANQTNWFTDNAYDILFKACLAEAEKFLKSDERIEIWNNDYLQSMPQVRRELYQQFGNQYDRLGHTPMPMAPRSLTP